jgi:hypothetical protein
MPPPRPAPALADPPEDPSAKKSGDAIIPALLAGLGVVSGVLG